MKKKTIYRDKSKRSSGLLWAAIILFGLTSCKTTDFYQFYRVNSTNDISKNSNSLVYEDGNCKVLYDFWGAGGEVGFMIYNKTDENIFVNMKESFFIKNGIAYDYYQNRKFTQTKSTSLSESNSTTAMYSYSALNAIGASASKSVSGYNYQGYKQTNSIAAGIASAIAATAGISGTKTKGITTSSGSSVSFKENDIICVPAKTAKVISEYRVTNTLYRDCNLLRYPSSGRQAVTVRFSEMQSPYIFSNRIVYTVGKSKEPMSFENKFYVSEVTNYPKKAVIAEGYEQVCGEKGKEKIEKFNNYSPDTFYLFYIKGKGEFKH